MRGDLEYWNISDDGSMVTHLAEGFQISVTGLTREEAHDWLEELHDEAWLDQGSIAELCHIFRYMTTWYRHIRDRSLRSAANKAKNREYRIKMGLSTGD